jgi:hypothetical protein
MVMAVLVAAETAAAVSVVLAAVILAAAAPQGAGDLIGIPKYFVPGFFTILLV